MWRFGTRLRREGENCSMKSDRQNAIIKIISENDVGSQEELVSLLVKAGYKATQATVSRDIKELKIIKIAGENGNPKYGTKVRKTVSLESKLIPVFKNSFVSCDFANNLIVVRTLSGMAQAMASAIDSMSIEGILGSVGGDDTVILVCRNEKYAEETVELFSNLSGGADA